MIDNRIPSAKQMEIREIVDYWRGQKAIDRRWIHEDDVGALTRARHSFNLEYPVSPYVGNIISAPVIILAANGGFDELMTPGEFKDEHAIQAHIARIDAPGSADWNVSVSPYYDQTNYGQMIRGGQAVLVNACAYRSRKISEEPENQAAIRGLASVNLARRWLLEAALPLARKGDRLIIMKRWSHWRLPGSFEDEPGVVKDHAPVSPYVTGRALARMEGFLG